MICSSYKQEVNNKDYSANLYFVPKYLGRGPVDASTIRVNAVDHESTAPPNIIDRVVRDLFIASSLNL
jgi:hypothetical protein